MSQQTVGQQRGVDTVFVLPGSHLDVGYTDTPSRVREVRVEVIEDAIRAARQDPEFRWFEEGGWAFDAWLQRYGQDEQQLATVRQLLQSGQLGVGATWLSPHAAAIPEAVGFLTLHLEDLDSLFNYRPTVAVLNDPPSYPEVLADALVARGIRYLLVGANMFVSRPLPSHLVRSPFWWELASGNRLLVYIDPDGFTAGFAKWGLGPRCARFFDDRRFPSTLDYLETMEAGIRAGIRDTPATYHAVIVQQALDNWGIDCARELPASASSTATTAGPSSTSTLLGPSAATLTTTPNPPLPRLEPEALRLRAKIYDPGRWTPTRRKKGGNTGEAWAFAALVSVLAQQYEREPGQIAKPSGAFLERVRTEISRVERAHSKDALRKRVARALKKRAAWT